MINVRSMFEVRSLSGCRWAFACVLTLAMTIVADRAEAIEAAFRDWAVVCAADGACGAGTQNTNANLVLHRSVTTGTGYEISVELDPSAIDPSQPIGLKVDNGPTRTAQPGRDYRMDTSTNRITLVDPGLASGLLPDLVAGGQLVLFFATPSGGTLRLPFSLSGLSASLLWIDEQQGRVGEPRIAQVPTNDSGDDTPRPPVEGGTGTGGLPEMVLARHSVSDCEPATAEFLALIPPISARLSQTATVHALPCTRGAYNVTHRLYLVETGEIGGIQPLYFVEYSERFGWTGTDILFNVDIDAATGTLSSFTKGRGLGDCGSAGTWLWQDYAFALVRFVHQEDCNGTPPEDWSIVFER